ncbi:hypothetical protein IC229_03955 [Spirosoma sp. BT702]|uniref:Uncharacterized protein n=1 Tax=Spirosoma profusum TaxID=2771354 RepID=A0A927ATB5_9BACT|nr:hypothetical protein [Spirosoma profusum]MBD2699777.1 hypothetical protein [Spirosoma profusum]
MKLYRHTTSPGMITSINEFPTRQQQVLQYLLTQPNYVTTPAVLMENISGPTGEVIKAIWELMRVGHVCQIPSEDNFVQLRLSDEMAGRLLVITKQEQAFYRYIGNTKY